MFDFDFEALGFTKKDINAIRSQCLYRIRLEDWESMLLFENEEAIFKLLHKETLAQID